MNQRAEDLMMGAPSEATAKQLKELQIRLDLPAGSNKGERQIKEPGLGVRHRDKNGEISRKHGNTLVRTLRKIYGSGFAPNFPDTAKLSDVLHKLDEPSLSHLHRDYDGRHLEQKIAQEA
jgi:hypothetical protein